MIKKKKLPDKVNKCKTGILGREHRKQNQKQSLMYNFYAI
ncbi:hypothetical protein N482_11270 [Pseudoalteromonas luteoviolacea NCIMB 1942]|uniref:Uncharacterized protein n=1 Tax=Pseudoalteromonas luteoviolacea NCIMB 1942 TaxID=1365253 RepID=A0A167BWM2_9GAMM|nr:hypothetical protein N482_11270 [Pseudoalteromonas luteoviolacea NCIMB 1942]